MKFSIKYIRVYVILAVTCFVGFLAITNLYLSVKPLESNSFHTGEAANVRVERTVTKRGVPVYNLRFQIGETQFFLGHRYRDMFDGILDSIQEDNLVSVYSHVELLRFREGQEIVAILGKDGQVLLPYERVQAEAARSAWELGTTTLICIAIVSFMLWMLKRSDRKQNGRAPAITKSTEQNPFRCKSVVREWKR
ncbi:MAG: hypothetical protein JW942_05245 [Opitutales bacterium]|nr:hypothetical protein [Opitutales bacterium]